jgi:acetylornithine deacetylase/succinyl-diaminopimelate desuccinylase-like protein
MSNDETIQAKRQEVHGYLSQHLDDFLAELMSWVRVKSVGGVPELQPELRRSANWLAGLLRETGFPTVELWETEGAPAVYAEWPAEAPDAPTVLVYSHHDVRAAKDDTWGEVPPFEPAVRDGRLWGRGASDAKGQVLCHVWGLRAYLATSGKSAPPVNLRLVVEGEEEQGSPHFQALLKEHREQVSAELIVLSDTLLWRADAPAMCTSLRGMVSAQLQVRGPQRDVHSGAVSGPAPNPVMELSRLVAQLHDEHGRITLPDFYDDIPEPAAEDRSALAALPYSDEDWLARSETASVGGEDGYTVLERLWLRPAAEVLTIIAGDPSGPARGAIPSVANASISIRTVPNQRVERVADQLRRWVADRISDRVDYELTIPVESGQEPYRTPPGTPALAALRAAMADGWNRKVDEVGTMGNAGGSPASLLHDVIGAPIVFFGTGLPEDHWHDSDESVLIDLLQAGAATLASLLPRLARLHSVSSDGASRGGS